MKKILFFIIVFSALVSSCVVMYPTAKEKDKEKPSEYGALNELQPVFDRPVEHAAIRPDQQPEQDYPNPANWEFYSQKNGTPLRRANADSVGKMFRPDIASLDTTDLNRFVIHGDSSFYKNFYGDSIFLGLLSASGGGVNIYTADGIIPAGVTRNVNLDTLSTLLFNYAISGPDQPYTAIRISSPDDSTGTDGANVSINGGSLGGNSYITVNNGGTEISFPDEGIFSVSGEGGDGQQTIEMTDPQLEVVMENGVGDGYSRLYLDTIGLAFITSQSSTNLEEKQIGFRPDIGGGLFINLYALPQPGEILVADADQTFKFADPSTLAVDNIYAANGETPDNVTRTVTVGGNGASETGYLWFDYSNNAERAINIFGGDGAGNTGSVAINSPTLVPAILIENDDASIGDITNTVDGGGFKYIPGMIRIGDPFDIDISGLTINLPLNTTTISESVENYLRVSSDGTGITGGWAVGSQFYVGNASETAYISQNDAETQIYNYNGDDYTGISIDTADGRVFIDKSKSDMAYKLGFDSSNGEGVVIFLSDTLPLEGQTLIAGSDQTFYFGEPSAGANIYNSDGETPDNVTRTVTVGGNGASEAGYLWFDYSNNVETALRIFGGDGAGGSGSVALGSPDGYSYIRLDNGGIESEYLDGQFSVIGNAGSSQIEQDPASVLISGADTQGSTALYRIAADTTGDMALFTRRNAGDQQAVLALGTGATGIVSAQLSAYNADAPRTLNAVVVDTSGVGINTQGSTGDPLQVLQSDGDKSYWGVKIEDGQLTADQLSFGVNGWENVNANRYMYSIGYGSTPSITPSVGATEIIIGDTATTSTVNLNFIPGNLDGADYSGINTTVRYIYNFGSGDATIDTNESWLFRLAGVGAGSSTVTLGTMKQAKLVWVAGSSTANSRFWVFITDLQ